jgi:hypothetical protein
VGDTWRIVCAMPEISEEVKQKIEEIVNGFPKAWENYAGGYVAAYSVVDKRTGKVVMEAKSGAGCHYGFSSITDNTVAVNGCREECHSQHPDYVKWVCQESPFAYGVLNRDNEEEIVKHAQVLDGALIGRGGCLWLGKALRYTSEDTFRLPTWYKLREAGLDGLQAFIGCSILNGKGARCTYNTHNSLVSYGSPVSLRRYYDDIKKGKKNETTQASYNTEGGSVNWGTLTGKKVKKSDGWGGFTEVTVPCDVGDFAAKLKEICEGDPKNVK